MQPVQPKNFESRVQDLVYNVDVGIGNRLIKGGLFIFAVLALMTLYTASEFWGLKHADAMDQAQVARELMRDGTFSTKVIRPASLWMLEEHGADPRTIMLRQPDLIHPPVYPWVLARVFGLFGHSFVPEKVVRAFPPEQWGIVPLGHVCTLLTGLLVFLIARRWFEPRIAALATALFFLTDTVWAQSISGQNLSLATLFSVLAVHTALGAAAAANARDGTRRWITLYLIASVCAALAFLTRYAAGWIALAVAIHFAAAVPRRGWKLGLGVLGIVLLLATPWMLRNVQVSGHLFGLTPFLALNGTNPGETLAFEQAIAPSFEAWVNTLRVKFIGNLRGQIDTALPLAGGGLLLALFATTFFFKFVRPHLQALRFGLLAAMGGVFLAGGLFGETSAQTFRLFTPFVILYGLYFFYLMLDRLQLSLPIYRSGIIAALITVHALPLVLTLLPPRVGFPYPPYYPSYITLVTQMMNEDELLCTDMPWATSWYGDRSSLLLPATVEDFYRINDLRKRISGIYFTSLTRDLPYVRTLATGPYSSWYPIFRERLPVDFPLTEAFFISNRDQLFLTDRPRWNRP